MTSQLNLFGVQICECGQTATITQTSIYGDDNYCKKCYDEMTKEKERVMNHENRHLV